ncbi:MAG: peptide ligase PGM1-related protein [Steroidobacteraceae bacterium]
MPTQLQPEPGSPAELARFAELQRRLAPLFRRVFADRLAPRTIVVVPGLSVDQELLARIDGLPHYEERQLTMLMLLRMPNTSMVFLTSLVIDPSIIDYYLQLLPGIPHEHARRRLTLLAAHDASPVSLTRKILDRPRLLARVRSVLGDPGLAHLSCYNATADERTLAVQLGVPLYACDPALAWLGTKSGSRSVFREAGVSMADGAENLRDIGDAVAALAELKRRRPALTRAVLKLEEGASGEGNATFDFAGAPDGATFESWIAAEMPQRLKLEAAGLTYEHYIAKFASLGGVAEAWIEGHDKSSPSAQLRINPLAGLETISTHEQVLGGATGQLYLGARFPARAEYRIAIQESALRAGRVLRDKGVLGRFSVDFVCVREGGTWRHHAIEINLRKGGTTHTFQTLQYLTDGHYDSASGLFLTQQGQLRFYYATDNLMNPHYRRLTPPDLVDLAIEHALHFDPVTQEGVTFNLIGAVSQFGKLGVVSIAASSEAADDLYSRTVRVLDAAC